MKFFDVRKFNKIAVIIRWCVAVVVGAVFLAFEIDKIFKDEEYSFLLRLPSFFGLFCVLFFVLTVLQIVFNVIITKKYNKTVIPLLNDRCDPRAFAEAQLPYMEMKFASPVYKCNYALGLWLSGEHQRAGALYDEILYSKLYEKQPPLLQAVILMNKLTLELETYNNVDEVSAMLARAIELTDKIPAKLAQYKAVKDQLDNLMSDIAFARGEYDDSYEKRNLEKLECAEHNYRRSDCVYSLAKYYRKTGDKRKFAMYAKEYISKYGGMLYATMLKAWLEEDGIN